MDYIVFIFKYSKSFYIVSDESESEAWKSLAHKLSKDLEKTKQEAVLITQQPFCGITKLKS
jgi:hypothetical protein